MTTDNPDKNTPTEAEYEAELRDLAQTDRLAARTRDFSKAAWRLKMDHVPLNAEAISKHLREKIFPTHDSFFLTEAEAKARQASLPSLGLTPEELASLTPEQKLERANLKLLGQPLPPLPKAQPEHLAKLSPQQKLALANEEAERKRREHKSKPS